MTRPPAIAPMMNRRHLLFGAAAGTLAACGGNIPTLESLPDPSAVDPLSDLRLSTRSDAKTWMRHLHLPSMQGAPNILALSGGGEDGAFGAGALNGWSAYGNRPDFDLVTGVSTGALIAPFAFVGSSQDQVLKQIFTEHDADDILRLRGVPGLFGDAIYDTKPLAALIEAFTPTRVLDAVAQRHVDGARLFVVTSNLDTAEGTVWNMGAIAQQGQAQLFREIMRASSALPGLFPPVTLEYKAQGRTVRETHIDGGVNMQLLAVPPAAISGPRRRSNGGHLYVLINNTLDPAPQPVARSVIGITQHALTTMIRSSAAETVRAARLFAQQSDLGLSVASIDKASGIVFDPGERFSQSYMRQLYDHGHTRAATGTLWGNLGTQI